MRSPLQHPDGFVEHSPFRYSPIPGAKAETKLIAFRLVALE
jgi:hypothetical protein